MSSLDPRTAPPTSTIAAYARAVAASERLGPLAVETSADLVLVRCPNAPWERARHAALLGELADHLVWPSLAGILVTVGQDQQGVYLKIAGAPTH